MNNWHLTHLLLISFSIKCFLRSGTNKPVRLNERNCHFLVTNA
ncbi:hypothetical protein D931_04021 [Enterococcus faecium 13.SD.W.09]|nr:hypothetical protein D931_04021 [Enterococcus faecium 13.SD.W.09]